MELNCTSNFEAFWLCCMAYTLSDYSVLVAFYLKISFTFPVNIYYHEICERDANREFFKYDFFQTLKCTVAETVNVMVSLRTAR